MAVITRSVDLSVVGANGGGWAVDLGAAIPTAPTSYSSTLAAAFKPMGAISEDGLAYGFDEDSQEFLAWGQLTPFRSQITRSLRTFQITLWETNRAINKSLMYRLPIADVTTSGAGDYTFQETATPTPDRRSFVFDVIDGLTLERFYVPVGEVTDRDDVSYKSDEIAGYNLTITAYADSNNVTVYHLGHVQLAGS
jgi:hypothetical protein